MSHAAMISVGILIVLIVVLALLRGKSVATKPLRGAHVALIVAVAVLVAAGIDYLVVMRPAKAAAGAAGQAPAEMGPGMGPGAGMMGPPGGGMGGGMGGPREPSPKRDLGRFVRQLTLFQEKGTDTLDAKQVATVLPILTGMQAVEKMSEDEGKAQLEALRAILTEAQLAAVDAIELPRRQGGMGGPGGPGMGAPAGPPPGTGGAPQGPPPDRAQAFRERMLAIPYVKQQYDAKVAEDSTFAQDQDRQREFFRSVMRELSPFQQGQGREALASLIKALQGGDAKPTAP